MLLLIGPKKSQTIGPKNMHTSKIKKITNLPLHPLSTTRQSIPDPDNMCEEREENQ
jgi:hypothetical protein